MKRQAAFAIALVLLGGCTTAPRVVPAAQIKAVLPGHYDPDNSFAKIIRGELPAAKVYEDDRVLAFMDYKPVERGHVLVISKRSQARNLLDVDLADFDRIMAVARRIGQAQMKAFGANGFSIEQNNGYGQTVLHLHVHVIPRYSGQPWGEKSGPPMPMEERAALAAQIRAALPPS
jgi:histidine triad (HIT) family protein